jgi:hypothetical protein
MVLGKKAVFFSIMALLLSALIILIFSSFLTESFDREALLINAQAEYVDDLVGNIDAYLAAQLQVSSYFALESLLDNYAQEGYFGDDGLSAQQELEACLLTGNFNPARTGFGDQCASNFGQYSEHLRNESLPEQGIFDAIEDAYTGMRIGHQIIDINVVQDGPYNLQVVSEVIVEINTSDSRWERYVVVNETVSLLGFRDPQTINTPYERNISLRPGTVGFPFSAGDVGNNFFHLENYSLGGYVYRDTSAPSFFATLDGTLPSSIAFFDDAGYTSIVPAYDGAGNSLYQNNQTPFLAHFRLPVNPQSFAPDDLVRINVSLLNTNQSFPRAYVDDRYESDVTDPVIFEVAGCCDVNGCNIMCS